MSFAAQQSRVSRGALWFGLIGGGAAWTVHLISASFAAEFGCVGRLDDHAAVGISAVAWLELALTLVTSLVAGSATIVSYRNHLRLMSDDADPAERSTAWAGLLTSGVFTFIIVFESIPILYYLHSC